MFCWKSQHWPSWAIFYILLLFLKVGFNDVTPGISFIPDLSQGDMLYFIPHCPLGSVLLWSKTRLDRTWEDNHEQKTFLRASLSKWLLQERKKPGVYLQMPNAYLNNRSFHWATPETKICECLRLFMGALRRNTPLAKQTSARKALIWLSKMTDLHIV